MIFTNCVDAGINILEQLAEATKKYNGTIDAYIAGGIAVAYWCAGQRFSLDLDVIFSHRIGTLPLSCKCIDSLTGNEVIIKFDANFNESLALMQPEYTDRARFVKSCGNIKAHILAPEDIAISKLPRFSNKDKEDIQLLVRNDLIDYEKFRSLAEDALFYYIGDDGNIKYGIEYVGMLVKDQKILNGGS